MRQVLSVLLLLLAAAAAAARQDPQGPPATPPSEQEQLEEEFIRSRADNGESHASGARPELGPVVLGVVVHAVVARAKRVGAKNLTVFLRL